jgi:hypothetical protein
MLAANPDDITMDRHIPSRVGNVYIDVGQNRGGATIASVYSVLAVFRPKGSGIRIHHPGPRHAVSSQILLHQDCVPIAAHLETDLAHGSDSPISELGMEGDRCIVG